MKISSSREIPASVYRLQFNENFTFKSALNVLPYLKDLGIEAVYCSPYFDSYSSHGYDITNPNRINPKIGSHEEFEEFLALLKKLNLKQILDVVPNHMGIKGGKNSWWQDVLENGPFSEYGSFFDIDWSPEKKELQDKVLFPILTKNYGNALENQEIKLHFAEGSFYLKYTDFPLPLAPHSYVFLLERGADLLKEKLKKEPKNWKEYQSLMDLYRFFPVAVSERSQKKEEAKRRLFKLVKNSDQIRKHVQETIAIFNGKKKVPESFDLLDRLIETQFYRLSFWKVASHEVNYRRFFNIHELVAIRIEEENVLKAHHRLVFELVQKGHVQGLRIDHPDGLYDPETYFERLRKRFLLYTVVEKILDRKEALSETWQVEGTVGYEYLNILNGIFIKKEHEKEFTEIYEEILGKAFDFEECLYESKKLFAYHEMVSEVESLGLKIDRLSENSRYFRDFTRHDLTAAISEVIACFPVYRTYVTPKGKISKTDAFRLKIAVEKAKKRAKNLDVSLFEFFEKLLLSKLKVTPPLEEGYRNFVLRFQQLTAPIMAKGLEDTTFYIYNRFISLNEVGGDPPHFGYSLPEFHRFNLNKRAKWPFGFLTTSTHDTKRSEDVRMRLNVLSEMPHKWRMEVKKWMTANAKYKKADLSPNTEYFIYQTLLGAWPKLPLKKIHMGDFSERMWRVILKSLREAKQETSWMFPNVVYEEGVKSFLFSILSMEKGNRFLKLFLPFQKEIDRFGSYNSLSALTLKMGSSGVVDTYQGCELWQYRLVDPDNRALINYDLYKKTFNEMKMADPKKLFISKDHGKIKFFLHWKALHFRREHKSLFLEGEYIPLKVSGACKNHVIAFMRKYKNERLIVLASRFFTTLAAEKEDLPIGRKVWKDTGILIENGMGQKNWQDVFTAKKIKGKTQGKNAFISLYDVFETLPFSFLYISN